MPSLARAHLESLLRARKLDRTLATAIPHELDTAATGIASLDARLGGGFPRGHLSEIVGSASSGRTSLLVQVLAAATRRGEIVALVDALDMFDVETGAAAGLIFDRCLWVRGGVPSVDAVRSDALEHAVKALSLVLQAGNFGVVAIDLAGAPPHAIRRLPFTTWMRLQRMVEGSTTTCLLVADAPIARSAAGLTMMLDGRPHFGAQLFNGLDVAVRIVNSRLPSGHNPHEPRTDGLFWIRARVATRARGRVGVGPHEN